jgi:hypothetical protein
LSDASPPTARTFTSWLFGCRIIEHANSRGGPGVQVCICSTIRGVRRELSVDLRRCSGGELGAADLRRCLRQAFQLLQRQ